MSEDKSPTSGSGNDNSTDDDENIIEAEIIKEKPRPTTKATVSTVSNPSSKLTLSKIGWGVALLALAFIGGIFAEPFAEQGLKRLGLMKEEPQQNLPVSEQNVDLTPLTNAQNAQKDRLAAIEGLFKTQQDKITSLETENLTLKRDITTLSAGLPTGEQTSSPAFDVIADRLDKVEAELSGVKTNTITRETDESVTTRLDAELRLARAETAQLLERLSSFEKSFTLSQSQKLSDSPEGRAAVTLHRLYLHATSGDDFSADIAALKPDLTNLPLLDLQPVSAALNTLELNQAGISSHSDIVVDFSSLIPSLLKANVAEESTGWIANFFTIRRTDAEAEGIEATIRNIESHLHNRNLPAASAEADNLPESAKIMLGDWLKTVKSRQNTMSALTSLLTTLAGDVI